MKTFKKKKGISDGREKYKRDDNPIGGQMKTYNN